MLFHCSFKCILFNSFYSVPNHTKDIFLSVLSCKMTSYLICIKQAYIALKKLQTMFCRFSTIKIISFRKETKMFIKCPREWFFRHMAPDYLVSTNRLINDELGELNTIISFEMYLPKKWVKPRKIREVNAGKSISAESKAILSCLCWHLSLLCMSPA